MRARILEACSLPADSYAEALARKEKIWEKLLERSEWVKEMGAYLIMSPNLKQPDRIQLNLHLHAIAGMKEEYLKNNGWSSFDTALIGIATRFDGVNIIASQYPDVVRKYKNIRYKAHQDAQKPLEPRTTFRQAWQKRYRYPLLHRFQELFVHERL